MNTDQLIEVMAADRETERPVEALLPRAILFSGLVMGVVFLAIVGPRPDPSAALTQISVFIKQAFPVVLAVGGFGAVLRLARPGSSVGLWAAAIAAVPVILIGAVSLAMLSMPSEDWYGAMMGKTHLFCLRAIPMISLPILLGSLWALRRGASTRPAVTGALAGLMSASVGTALYAIHCVEDSPLFYATWYGIGIGVITALGAILGPRILRW